MTDRNEPIAIVQRMYAAFGTGDLDALIETVHPESRWIYLGANRVQYSGKTETVK